MYIHGLYASNHSTDFGDSILYVGSVYTGNLSSDLGHPFCSWVLGLLGSVMTLVGDSGESSTPSPQQQQIAEHRQAAKLLATCAQRSMPFQYWLFGLKRALNMFSFGSQYGVIKSHSLSWLIAGPSLPRINMEAHRANMEHARLAKRPLSHSDPWGRRP